MRREFSAKTKLQAWQRSAGYCESAIVPQIANIGCKRKLFPGDIRYEHIVCDGLTGEPTVDNCAVLCRACWRIKTDTYDLPVIAKAKRRERANIGIRKPSRMPGSRNSKWKIKINREVVLR